MSETPLWKKVAAVGTVTHAINFLAEYPDDEDAVPLLEEAFRVVAGLKKDGWTGAAAELEQRLKETKEQCHADRKKREHESAVSGTASRTH